MGNHRQRGFLGNHRFQQVQVLPEFIDTYLHAFTSFLAAYSPLGGQPQGCHKSTKESLDLF
jgi:hypothetical protein